MFSAERNRSALRPALLVFVLLIFVTLASRPAAAGIVPDYDFQWVTIGAVGNVAYSVGPFDRLAGRGIDAIYCVSVNDAFVMNAWGRQQGLEHVKLIPDGSGDFTRRMGMLVCKDDLGFGLRSWRYAAIVNDGVVEAWFEEPGISDNCATDPYGESAPQNILDKLTA